MRVDTRVWSPFACVPVHHEKWEVWEEQEQEQEQEQQEQQQEGEEEEEEEEEGLFKAQRTEL